MAALPTDLNGLSIELDDGVAVLLIDNGPINLIDRQLYGSLRRAIDWAATDDDVRVVVLRSANPDYFMAHFDVELILSFPIDSPAERSDTLSAFHLMGEQLRTMPKPTICEIDGRVGGGGGELSASCDMRFGTPRTILCQMEVPLGILPGGAGTQRLPRLIGRGRAMEVVLGGDDIEASTLFAWGWLNRVVAAEELRSWVDAFAARLAGFPPEAVARAKASVLAAGDDPVPGLLDEAMLFQETLRTDAAQARMRAFLERGGQTPEGESRVGALGNELG
ncbi:MAG: enoyl-CoA hydratase/isomerase family protein [Acidimicrobiales bacterium]